MSDPHSAPCAHCWHNLGMLKSRVRQLLWPLLLAALLLRGLVPVGFMPAFAADGGFSIVLCTPQGMLELETGGEHPTSSALDGPCEFGLALGMAALSPASDLLRWYGTRDAWLPPSSAPIHLADARGNHRARAPPGMS